MHKIKQFKNKSKAICQKCAIEEFQKNTGKYSRIITPIKGKSIDAINDITIPLHSLDFLFIDGDHSYESVKQDFLLYSKLLKKGSLLIFHDYACNDVKKVISENAMHVVSESDSLPNLWWGKYNING